MLYTNILKNNKDFVRLYKRGRNIASKACIVYYMPNNAPYNRIGITTGKKVGNAVARNRSRRVIRAAYRKIEKDFPIGFDIVIVARAYCSQCKSQELEEFFTGRVLSNFFKSNTQKTSQKYKKN